MIDSSGFESGGISYDYDEKLYPIRVLSEVGKAAVKRIGNQTRSIFVSDNLA